ncbi:hypothetical protein ABXN37_27190 [Piscinibacter sakaiensis]|uniref:Acb2/Tad1 hairpin domain-containing protein n=1 Tax=Piscinibacter sakaiensis TaxID=1547922 RepID=A0A0K8P9C5_PISS1|nr:hypothetical protein [Piscinibacter sakaiensis]GAP38785.1 hypothetical protein ISF6_5338 [Piscinibacter sakaiensis]
MRIFTDHNGVAVNAIAKTSDGQAVEGHLYQVLAGTSQQDIRFQLGPVQQAGVNGATNEALIAVLVHRLQHLNRLCPCRENSLAITKLEEAAHWLEARTRDRQARQVEGTSAA